MPKENSMRKKLMGGVAFLIIATLAWAGGDPWKTKPPSQWTEKDVADILANSPWARANVSVFGANNTQGMTQATGTGGTAGSKTDLSKNAAGATPDTMGGSEKEDEAAAAAASYSVYWWSSRTIRAASMRRAVLKGTMKEEDVDKTFATVPDDLMILIQSPNMAIFQRRGEAAFEKDAWLQMKKSKEKVFPTKVGFLKAADGTTVNGVIFYFPRKSASGEPTIATDEKEVDFYLLVGGSKILTAFDPRKMADSKGEDL
jgi:hypothetical protein